MSRHREPFPASLTPFASRIRTYLYSFTPTMSVAELATATREMDRSGQGISEQAIWDWFYKDARPRTATLKLISETTGIALGDLLRLAGLAPRDKAEGDTMSHWKPLEEYRPFARLIVQWAWSQEPPLNRAQVAARLGVRSSTINKLLNEGVIPEAATLGAISLLTSIPLARLYDALAIPHLEQSQPSVP